MFLIINRKGRFLKMKNKWFVGFCVLLAVGFVLAGCNTGSDPSGEHDPALVGTWEETWETMTFNSDGGFIVYLMGQSVTPPNATWSTSNGVISLDFIGRTRPETASYSISGNKLTTTNCYSGFLGEGDTGTGTAVYTRVP
jgi:hypothetical protein